VGVLALVALLSGCSAVGRPVPIDDPDGEVRDFQIGDLTAKLWFMTPGVERDDFWGILASRSGRTE